MGTRILPCLFLASGVCQQSLECFALQMHCLNFCLQCHMAFSLCVSVSPFIRVPVTGVRAHLIQHDLILTYIFITSAKTWFPDKVTFTGARCPVLNISLWGIPFNPQNILFQLCQDASWLIITLINNNLQYSLTTCYVMGNVRSTLDTLFHVILSLYRRNCYYPHFTDEETETQRRSNRLRSRSW